jgi:hypothetical protein
MMNELRDPDLQSLFRQADRELDGEALTARVIRKIRKLKLLVLAGSLSAVLLLLGGAWLIFGVTLFEFTVLISEALATPLFDLGQGWLALLLLPANTVATLLVITFKALRIFHKRVAGTLPGRP